MTASTQRALWRALPALVLCGLATLAEAAPPAEDDHWSSLLQSVHSLILERHYAAPKIDDEISRRAFDLYLESLDADKKFLLAADVEELRRAEHLLDDFFAAGNTAWPRFAADRLVFRARQVMSFYEELLARPFDFTRDEVILTFSAKGRRYCRGENELRTYWRQILEYATLLEYLRLLDREAPPAEPVDDRRRETPPEIDGELEAAARDSVRALFRGELLKLLEQGRREPLVISRFLNSLLAAIDPHTIYHLPAEHEVDQLTFTGGYEGVGLQLDQEYERFRIRRVMAGGPAWRQGEIRVGDFIRKVAEGDGAPVSVDGWRMVDVIAAVRGPKGSTVRLLIERPDGTVEEIALVRDAISSAESRARSAVLAGAGRTTRVGYLHLPFFYAGSHADVREELARLLATEVEGVIFDLRGNRGGSVEESVRTAGLLLRGGPVLQTRDRSSQIRVFADPEPGVAYSGPLILLVDGATASAAEIFASTLQDYRRALLVGSRRTVGKATSQYFLDLDELLDAEPGRPSFGVLQLTMEKSYRPTGRSNQLHGVAADIVLQGPTDTAEIGERTYAYPLESDTVPAVRFARWPADRDRWNDLIERSQRRVSSKPEFGPVQAWIDAVLARRDESVLSLRLADVLRERDTMRRLRQAAFEPVKEWQGLDTVEAPGSAEGARDDEPEARREWHQRLAMDPWLGEALEVMHDLLEVGG